VILGTSVSRRLITDSLGRHFINLSFNAWTVYDGLGVVKMKGKPPACLLIETNYVRSLVLQPELSGIMEPISYYSGRMLKSMQLANQPAGLLVGWGKSRFQSRIDAFKEKKRQDTGLYNLNIRQNVGIMNEITPDSILIKRFAGLKQLFEQFQEEGTSIIFYEVPIDHRLRQTNSMVEVRKYFNDYFPKKDFRYISLPEKDNYIYTDGVHLNKESALAYTLYLKQELNKLKGIY